MKLFHLGLIYALLVFPIALIAATAPDDLRANVALALKENGLTGAVWATVTPDGAIRPRAPIRRCDRTSYR